MKMEIWDVYDRDRHLTGRTVGRGEPLAPGDYHLVVDAYFLNERGQMLIQRRAACKKLLPDIWAGTSGAVVQGEDSRTGVRREVEEELGFTPDFEHGRLLLGVTDDPGQFHRDVYLFHQTVPIERMRLQAEEVAEVRWVYPEEIASNPDYRAGFGHLWEWPRIAPAIAAEIARIRVPAGVYRHYKGGLYQVTDVAVHSETLEPMAVYRALYGTRELWVRPAAMWNEEVTVDGRTVRRFAPVTV